MDGHQPQQPIAQAVPTTSGAEAPAFGTVDVQHLLKLLGLVIEQRAQVVGPACEFVVGQGVLLQCHTSTFHLCVSLPRVLARAECESISASRLARFEERTLEEGLSWTLVSPRRTTHLGLAEEIP